MRKRFALYLLSLLLIGAVAAIASRALFVSAAPEQPIAFPHKTHVVDNKMDCAFCHKFADKSPVAGLPGVQDCMVCHQVIKTDSPEIQKLADYMQKGQEIPWARVYRLPESGNVIFTHKRHVKARVDCATCHGNAGSSMRVTREVEHTMTSCMDCHRSNNASIDCLTCHK